MSNAEEAIDPFTDLTPGERAVESARVRTVSARGVCGAA